MSVPSPPPQLPPSPPPPANVVDAMESASMPDGPVVRQTTDHPTTATEAAIATMSTATGTQDPIVTSMEDSTAAAPDQIKRVSDEPPTSLAPLKKRKKSPVGQAAILLPAGIAEPATESELTRVEENIFIEPNEGMGGLEESVTPTHSLSHAASLAPTAHVTGPATQLSHDDPISMSASDSSSPAPSVAPISTGEAASSGSVTQPIARGSSSTSSSKKKSSAVATGKEQSVTPSSSTAAKKGRKAKPNKDDANDSTQQPVQVPPSLTAPQHDEESETYCICKMDEVEGDSMIQCDLCEQWYHFHCLRISNDESNLIDDFFCFLCEAQSAVRTTWKAKCRRTACPRPALAPLSRYCSERCGVLTVADRMQRSKHLKTPAAIAKLAADPNVSMATRKEGMVVWHDPDDPDGDALRTQASVNEVVQTQDDKKRNWNAAAIEQSYEGPQSDTTKRRAQSWYDRFEARTLERNLAGLDFADRQTIRRRSLDSGAAMLGTVATSAQLRILSIQLASLTTQKDKIHSAMDLIEDRIKLVHLVTDRAASLSPAPEGPRCGYDPILNYDDEALQTWLDQPANRAWLNGAADPQSSTPPPPLSQDPPCALAKRRCKRHPDWSNTRETSLELERFTTMARLERIEDLQIEIRKRVEETRKRQQVEAVANSEKEARRKRWESERDERLAREMAEEGKRRRR